MSESIINAFNKALTQNRVIVPKPKELIPPSVLAYNNYCLSDNPKLSASICDQVAKKTGSFLSYKAFLNIRNKNPEKPIEPDKNDPIFNPPRAKQYSPELVQQYGLKNLRRIETVKNYLKAQKQYEMRRTRYQKERIRILYIRETYSLNESGYTEYVCDSLKVNLSAFVQNFFFTLKPLLINEAARKKHTFITGATGSGKSETIKHIIRHYLTKNTEPALVLLDPHGDLANDVARFQENATNERLVYIKPNAFKGRTFSFNPFDFTHKDEINLNRGQKQFLGAIQEIIGEDLTKPQKAILTPCLGVLLHKDGTTLKDLLRFMDDNQNKDLIRYGQTKLPNESDRDFFNNQFHARNFESTKEALKYRFSEIIRDPIVREFLCNESTFDFAEALEAGKLIVFHFDPEFQTKECVRTIGQLINAYLISYAMRRPQGQRRPIHLFADECQYFISPTIETIMGEARKFNLFTTLATQRTDQVGLALIDSILSNVGCFIVGKNKNKTAEKLGKELPISADEIRDMNGLEFYQINLDHPPIKTKIDIIGHKYALTGEKWRDVLLDQGKRYYRSEIPAPEYDKTQVETPDKSLKGQVLKHLNQERTHTGRKPKFKTPDISTHPDERNN